MLCFTVLFLAGFAGFASASSISITAVNCNVSVPPDTPFVATGAKGPALWTGGIRELDLTTLEPLLDVPLKLGGVTPLNTTTGVGFTSLGSLLNPGGLVLWEVDLLTNAVNPLNKLNVPNDTTLYFTQALSDDTALVTYCVTFMGNANTMGVVSLSAAKVVRTLKFNDLKNMFLPLSTPAVDVPNGVAYVNVPTGIAKVDLATMTRTDMALPTHFPVISLRAGFPAFDPSFQTFAYLSKAADNKTSLVQYSFATDTVLATTVVETPPPSDNNLYFHSPVAVASGFLVPYATWMYSLLSLVPLVTKPTQGVAVEATANVSYMLNPEVFPVTYKDSSYFLLQQVLNTTAHPCPKGVEDEGFYWVRITVDK